MKATEVTAGLAESNGSLLPGLSRDSLHVTCGLTACTPGSAPGPTLVNEYGKIFTFAFCCQHGGRAGRVLHSARERPATEAGVDSVVRLPRHQLSPVPVRRPLPQRNLGRPQLLGLRVGGRRQGEVPGLSARLLLRVGRRVSRHRHVSRGLAVHVCVETNIHTSR